MAGSTARIPALSLQNICVSNSLVLNCSKLVHSNRCRPPPRTSPVAFALIVIVLGRTRDGGI